MSGLLDSLSTASRALDAQRMGLDVVGQNLANINTEGYTRRTLVLAEVGPTDPRNAGRGVMVVEVRALRDQFVDARLRREQQGASFDQAQVDGLATVEAAIGTSGSSLDANITAFFGAFSNFANDVSSIPGRDGVVQQGVSLARGFNDMASRLSAARYDADATVRAGGDQVNTLARQVAALNSQIGAANGGDVSALEDQRGNALSRLAELAGVSVMERPDGLVDVTIGQGRALVVGGNSYALTVAATGIGGMSGISLNGSVITSELTTGSIGGALAVRDTIVPGYEARLDQLAHDFATEVNSVHQSGFDGNGAAGGDFFAPPGAVVGAASRMAMDSAVAADSQLVAGSSTGTAGDNQTAQQIAALRNARVMSGGTATAVEAWGQLVYRVGSDIASARASSTSRGQVVQQLQRLRDSASGVSLDEEAAHLMKYQRAYEANARFFVTISDTLDALMQMVG